MSARPGKREIQARAARLAVSNGEGAIEALARLFESMPGIEVPSATVVEIIRSKQEELQIRNRALVEHPQVRIFQ